MEEYEVFNEYLKKSSSIRNFCDQKEKLLFECIRMDIATHGKVHWLSAVGSEIDKVTAYIDELIQERKSASLGI